MSDALRQILAMVRAEMPQMDDAMAARLEIKIRKVWGGSDAYIGAQPKRVKQLEMMIATPTNGAKDLARALGCSTRTAYRVLEREGASCAIFPLKMR